MFIVNTYSIAVLFTVITMLCWGSWANTQKLAGKTWRFELFYWDYVLGIVLASIIYAFTMGSMGADGRGFLEDLQMADGSNIRSALLGGVVFNLANILLSAAISIAGMAVAFPVGIGIALVMGVLINYFATPSGSPVLLFIGVFLIAVAILLDAKAYSRLMKNTVVSKKGVVLAIVAGVLMSLFYRFVAASMTQDYLHPDVVKLTPYTAMFFFALGIFASNFIFNTWLMKKPLEGSPVKISDYFIKGNVFIHLTGVLGGLIWSTGMLFNIVAAGKAGYAISYGLGQGATLVAALWGVFVWKEFKNADKLTNWLLFFMFIFFLIGIGLIILAGV